MYVFDFSMVHLLPARASEQGNVIGSVRIIINVIVIATMVLRDYR